MVTGTLDELTPSGVARVRRLTYVLSCDDLLRDDSRGFVLDGAALAIGRALIDGPAAMAAPGTLRLPDRWMSGEHAVIEARGDGDVIRDLGSRNGTWVDGERVTERRLVSGALIEVGHSLLCYRVVEQPPRPDRGAPTAAQVIAALEASGGNVVRAATALASHPRQLYRWIERFGIDLERYRG